MEVNFEEILDKHIGINTLLDLKKQLVLKAMKEVWNLAIDKAAEEAITDGVEVEQGEYNWFAYRDYVSVDKDSILKLKV